MAEYILVVDDTETVATITAAMLRTRGYEVQTAVDGSEALIAVQGQRPSCILLDIMMPKMSGLEVLAKLKEDPETATIPVILLTAKSQDEDVLVGYKEGADYYITKPFTSRELIYGINLVLSKTTAAASGAE